MTSSVSDWREKHLDQFYRGILSSWLWIGKKLKIISLTRQQGFSCFQMDFFLSWYSYVFEKRIFTRKNLVHDWKEKHFTSISLYENVKFSSMNEIPLSWFWITAKDELPTSHCWDRGLLKIFNAPINVRRKFSYKPSIRVLLFWFTDQNLFIRRHYLFCFHFFFFFHAQFRWRINACEIVYVYHNDDVCACEKETEIVREIILNTDHLKTNHLDEELWCTNPNKNMFVEK